MERESSDEKGIHFLGLGTGLSDTTCGEAKGLRLGTWGGCQRRMSEADVRGSMEHGAWSMEHGV